MIRLNILYKSFCSVPERYKPMQERLIKEIEDIKKAGTYKKERIITSQQYTQIIAEGKELLNFCANNYLGLSNNKEIMEAAKEAIDSRGFGMSSVRFICGTQDIHKQLEKAISDFYGTEDTILYSSCFDSNAGFFEAILGKEDAIITDALNHASIIDGIRACKATRFIYKHLDMEDLEKRLQETQKFRFRVIATDGVFSMDGDFAPLDKIVPLADKYNALIFIDEAHATGFLGPTGIGTPEMFGVQKDIDIISGTLGKALGGGTGGYTTGRKEIIEMLRQRSRPYLFSNSIAPPIVGASLKVFEILKKRPEFRENIKRNTKLFREQMKAAGFKILGNDQCPIAPVYIGDAKLAGIMADKMLQEGIYVIGFSYPVVPKGQARVRVQLSAAHTEEQIMKCVEAFKKIGKELNII